MHIRLYNTLTRSIEPFEPIDAGEVRMYTCGPTVYNHAHIGNLRAFLFPDLLQRVLRVVGGYKVRWVMNITDIDDKTIRDSAIGSPAWKSDMGEQTDDVHGNLTKLTAYYTTSLIEDIEMVGIRRGNFHAIPFATDYIPQMQELIRAIVAKGFGYVRNGSVYFDVAAWRKVDIYGKLVKIDADNFQEGVRIDADQYEREQVSDFVMWKGRKDGEPYWDFEIGGENCPGRPGWHIECCAMEFELLGLPFDIHTAGVDLKFPHHEDEIAQSKAGYGIEPTNFWCHNEFLEVEGKKMSKSLGNFYTLRDLLNKGIDPLDIRYLMLSAHYTSRLNFTFAGLEAVKSARLRVQEYIYTIYASGATERCDTFEVSELRHGVFAELADNINVAKALARLFTFINEHPAEGVPTGWHGDLLAFFIELNDIFAVWEIGPRPMEVLDIPDEIRMLAERRWQAKKDRNFADADALRKQIAEEGFVIHDTKDGYAIEKA